MRPLNGAGGSACRVQQGISLVELMVGILVGLLVVMAASGSLAFFEGQRKTSLSGNAAMNSGVMAGYLLQRDLRNAGVGLMNATQLGCTSLNLYYNDATRADGCGRRAGADRRRRRWTRHDQRVLRRFGAGQRAGEADAWPHHRRREPARQLDLGLADGRRGADRGHRGHRSLQRCADLAASPPAHRRRSRARGRRRFPWNPADPAAAFANAPLYPAGGRVVMRTGSTHHVAQLQRRQRLRSTPRIRSPERLIQVATNVVSLQAQYGVTDGISNEVRRWVDATDEWANPDRRS